MFSEYENNLPRQSAPEKFRRLTRTPNELLYGNLNRPFDSARLQPIVDEESENVNENQAANALNQTYCVENNVHEAHSSPDRMTQSLFVEPQVPPPQTVTKRKINPKTTDLVRVPSAPSLK